MSPSEKTQSFILLQLLRTPALVVLLIFVETLLGIQFYCPEKEDLAIIYSLMYLFLPAAFLVMSNLLLTPRRSSGSFPSQPLPPCTRILFLIIQLGKAPLIWVSIVLHNGKFLPCLFRNLDYWIKPKVFPSLQICGLILLVLCVTLEYSVPRLPFVQKHLLHYNRTRHEELILRDIEVCVQEAADKKRKAFVQSMISTYLDKLHPEDPGMQEVMSHLIQQCQEEAKKGFTAGGEGRGAGLKVQMEQSETPPQIMT